MMKFQSGNTAVVATMLTLSTFQKDGSHFVENPSRAICQPCFLPVPDAAFPFWVLILAEPFVPAGDGAGVVIM
jgi:hypothetical protein